MVELSGKVGGYSFLRGVGCEELQFLGWCKAKQAAAAPLPALIEARTSPTSQQPIEVWYESALITIFL